MVFLHYDSNDAEQDVSSKWMLFLHIEFSDAQEEMTSDQRLFHFQHISEDFS